MTNPVYQIAFLVFVALVPLHLWAAWKLSKIIEREKPEWLKRGSLSGMYDGMPRIADPNAQMSVLRTAFSGRVRELTPTALMYAKIIRVALPLGLILFALILETMPRAVV